jgi:hypothetical protein
MDDVFSTTGAARGQVRRDTATIFWNSTIVEPLIKKMNCQWIVKGTVRTVRENATNGERWQGVINYGNGDCDNRAIVVINGVTYSITLP